jgi:hypothetical protein
LTERLLVCGGRYYDNRALAFKVLDAVHAERPVTLVIEGGASGADTLAREWAVARGIARRTFEAHWITQGPAAGPIRNRLMITEGRPTRAVAFPGGRGTANMLKQLRAAHIPVMEIHE